MKEDKTCKICGKIFTRRNYMQKHMENIHSKRYCCPKCFRFFSGPTDHSCAIANGRFLCYVRDCSLRFSNGMAMRLHIRDCHRKMDEDGVGQVMKTKKGIREMVQNLCKKINLLNNCFDELKYQVDTISEFLKSKNFGFEIEKPVNTKVSATKKGLTEVKSELEYQEEYEDIDYIDEEYEDELMPSDRMLNVAEFQDKNAIILDESSEFISIPKTDASNKLPSTPSTSVSIQPALKLSAVKLQDTNISEPKRIFVSKFSSTSASPLKNLSTKSSSSLVIENPARIVSLPATTTIGSTIITQIPANLVKLQSPNVKHKPATTLNIMDIKRNTASTTIKSIKNDSPTPPLFLKINYDPATTVCATDPKITFHFDTKPPDEI